MCYTKLHRNSIVDTIDDVPLKIIIIIIMFKNNLILINAKSGILPYVLCLLTRLKITTIFNANNLA